MVSLEDVKKTDFNSINIIKVNGRPEIRVTYDDCQKIYIEGPKIEPPDYFKCSISDDLMKEPVLTMDGHIYDKSEIEKWFKNNRTSPNTNEILDSKKTINVIKFRQAILEWMESTCNNTLILTTILKNNNKYCYKGKSGNEQLVRIECQNKDIFYYEGDVGFERKVLLKRANGEILKYKGSKGKEALIEKEIKGINYHYCGTKDKEVLRKIVRKDFFTKTYIGQRGFEKLIRIEFSNGNIELYEGVKNEEALKKRHYKNSSRIEFYDGPKGKEYLVQIEDYEKKDSKRRKITTSYSLWEPI